MHWVFFFKWENYWKGEIIQGQKLFKGNNNKEKYGSFNWISKVDNMHCVLTFPVYILWFPVRIIKKYRFILLMFDITTLFLDIVGNSGKSSTDYLHSFCFISNTWKKRLVGGFWILYSRCIFSLLSFSEKMYSRCLN